MVEHPAEYRWSSFRANGDREARYGRLIRYTYSLGAVDKERWAAYRELLRHQVNDNGSHAIRTATAFSMPLGNRSLVEQIERPLGRRIGQAARHRPSKGEVE